MTTPTEIVQVWDTIHKSRVWGSYPNEAIIRLVKRARFEPYARALDIGCGAGANTWFLARENFTVTGIDGSATALIRAADRIARDGLHADLVQGVIPDVFKGIRDKSFDLAVDSYCLYLLSLDEMFTAINEVHRILRPGGRFISLVFAPATSPAVLAEGGGQVLSKPQVFGQFKSFSVVSVGYESRAEGETSVNTWVVSATKES